MYRNNRTSVRISVLNVRIYATPVGQLRLEVGFSKGVSHIPSKKKQDSKKWGVLSNISNPTAGLVFSEPLHAVREQQKQDFCQKQDLVPNSS